MVVGFIHFISVLQINMTALDILPSFIIIGSGSGFIMALIGSLAISLVRGDESGEAYGIFNALQNLGNSLGRSIIGALLVTTASIAIVDGVLTAVGITTTPEEREVIIFEFQEAVVTLSRDEFRTTLEGFPEQVQLALQDNLSGSALKGMRVATIGSIVVTALALVLAFFLPGSRQESPHVSTERDQGL
jgi:hypothetical protein